MKSVQRMRLDLAWLRHEDTNEPPERRYRSVTSVLMDLDTGDIQLSDGPPCEAPYQALHMA